MAATVQVWITAGSESDATWRAVHCNILDVLEAMEHAVWHAYSMPVVRRSGSQRHAERGLRAYAQDLLIYQGL